MGHVPIAQPSPRRRFHLSRRGIAWLLVLGTLAATLALAVIFAWPGGEGGPRASILVANADDFAPGSVTTFRESEFHLVRLEDGQFLALSMLDPHDKLLVEEGLAESPCLVPWRADFTFLGRTGWFRNPCHGETYDMTGNCVSGPCPRGLDRYAVTVDDGQVAVDLGELILGRPANAQVTPGSSP